MSVERIDYVYVAGPYSGTEVANMRAAIETADLLLAAGFFPFLPHLTGLWDLVCPHEYEMWTAFDLCWLKRCDAVYRMAGASPGADREVELANDLGIPVFTELFDLQVAAKKAP